jgi:hypothetical protein
MEATPVAPEPKKPISTVNEPWAEAVADATEDAPADAIAAIEGELVDLWSDLAAQHHRALNSFWSMGCDNLARRIVQLSRLVGATPWEEMQSELILNGVYQGLLSSAGIPFAAPDLVALEAHAVRIGLARCAECGLWNGNHQQPCSLRPRTMAELDRERAL